MQEIESVFSKACTEISQKLLALSEPTKNEIKSEIKKICTKYSLERIPRNYEILSTVNEKEYDVLQKVLLKKPVKTASGVAVIALMPKPYACPHGRCTYCPGGVEFNTPNSYTGKEPVTINAIENHYEPNVQITSKLNQLQTFGHDATKVELVIVGGTFLFMPRDYQETFVKSCYDALNGFESINLHTAMKNNETAKNRSVGFTIETKPDYCKKEHVDLMLSYGVTRVEIGVQSLHENVYKITNRGHDYNDVLESFQISKDSGYKIVAHMMPGLPTMTPKDDIDDFKKLFSNSSLKPDMLKIYPSLVLENTQMYNDYLEKKYIPYDDEEMLNVLVEAKKAVPKWVRIMRVQREITPNEIHAGPKSGNLRQTVHKRLEEQGFSCKCIRCREAGLTRKNRTQELLRLTKEEYDSSGGREVFISFEDNDETIYGFLRLRKPSELTHRNEITSNSCIVRELHVFGKAISIGEQEEFSFQHQGIGKKLMMKAEEIASTELSSNKLCVISAVGTREYYKKLNYKINGPYMAKEL